MLEVPDDELQRAVAENRSWRGVLRTVGGSSPKTGRELRARCDAVGIDYSHFGTGGPKDEVVRAAVAGSTSWAEAVARAGYARESGSARAQLRRRCAQLGIESTHLTAGTPAHEVPLLAPARPELLSVAGAMLVAGRLTLSGYRVCWPLEPAPYDLLVDDGRQVHRVQVKTTTVFRAGSWSCSIGRSTYDSTTGRPVRDVYVPGEVDVFAVLDGDLRLYLIPYTAVAGMKLLTLRSYEAYLLPRSFETPEVEAAVR